MAEETTSTTSDQQLSQIINQLLAGRTTQPAVDPNVGPSSRDGRGILSLLGEGLGGGSQYGSTAEREQGGLSALGAAGARMLQASDWSVMPHTFGSILGQGLDAARGNLGHTQAVSAAQHYAAQQLAHEQQQDQIARLKEALPYLQLQEDQRAAARQRELLKPGSTSTSIGTGGSISGPFMTALAVIESNDQNIVSRVDSDSKGKTLAQGGNPDEISQGHYQINPDTWRRYAKQAGVDPAQYSTPMKAPKEVQAAVASVIPLAQFGPRTRKLLRDQFGELDDKQTIGALAGARAAPSAPAKVQATPGQAPAPRIAPEPPLATTAPGQTAQGPEEGTVQVAGTDVGAPTSGVIPPSPPGSDATVAAIEEGRASSPARTGAPQPGAVVTAQAGGQQPPATQLPPIKAGDGLITHPGTYSEYRAREYVPPPATEDFNPNLTPQQQAAFASEAKAIEQRALAVSAMRKPDEKSVQEILAAREEIKAKIQMAAQEKAQKAALAITKYNETQDNAIRPRYEKEVDAYKAAAQANLTHSQTMEQKDKEGEISRLNTREGSFVESNKIIRDTLGKEAVAAAGKMQSLEGLRALSDNVGDNNATLQSLANIKYGGTTLLNHLTNAGIVGKGDAGPIQMLQSGISGAITELRAGIQMGALSDRDLSFIESMGPSLYEDRATRSAVISYLQQAARAKMRFNTIYNEQMARPNANSGDALEKTREIMDTKHPIVPQMPADIYAHRRDPDPEWRTRVAEWAQENNVKPRTLYRAPGGGLKLVPDPGTPGGD